jgi:hypothetical protein
MRGDGLEMGGFGVVVSFPASVFGVGYANER